jgi:hypothetical protein
MPNPEIVTCVIHPGIGVARVGNSASEFFIGPEVPGPPAPPPGGYKDASGAIKRQAARFRIYGLDAKGQVVKEITSADATITWRVHVANAKAAWYCYNTALDLPGALPTPRRNPAYVGDQRTQLVVDPGAKTISGINQCAPLDGGTFLGVPVSLGKLHTDEQGRLLVLGGCGSAYTPWTTNLPSTSTDNDAWCDDTSDGPVSATVVIDGVTFEPYPAWVIVAPPAYAPQVPSVVTMYDVVKNTLSKWLVKPPAESKATPTAPPPPPAVSFTNDIYPIFERLVRHQWVNYAFFIEYGWGAPSDFTADAWITRLADNSDRQREFRNLLFGRFRNPAYLMLEPHAIPQLYGDAIGELTSPQQWLAVTALQYANLQAWALGNFAADWNPERAIPKTIDEVPLAEQRDALDQAALEHCVGGAFHPGSEATWPMRIRSIYHQFCRFRFRPGGQPSTDYGDLLTQAIVTGGSGPLDFGLRPGDVTKWLSAPWQTDTVCCRSGYDPTFDLYIPTFWPTAAPNHVLTDEDYAIVVDDKQPMDVRIEAFNNRPDWLRHISRPNQRESLQLMLTDWYRLGIITERPGPTTGNFPRTMLVETAAGFEDPPVHYTHPSQWDPRL